MYQILMSDKREMMGFQIFVWPIHDLNIHVAGNYASWYLLIFDLSFIEFIGTSMET